MLAGRGEWHSRRACLGVHPRGPRSARAGCLLGRRAIPPASQPRSWPHAGRYARRKAGGCPGSIKATTRPSAAPRPPAAGLSPQMQQLFRDFKPPPLPAELADAFRKM